jgi:hypothetical protein
MLKTGCHAKQLSKKGESGTLDISGHAVPEKMFGAS